MADVRSLVVCSAHDTSEETFQVFSRFLSISFGVLRDHDKEGVSEERPIVEPSIRGQAKAQTEANFRKICMERHVQIVPCDERKGEAIGVDGR